jgi:two-component system, NtrC family, sensor kinase
MTLQHRSAALTNPEGKIADERPPFVLIVDDVEANLISLEALLEGLTCQVIRARSGNEALRELLRHPFAVMLLDVQMPEMDGYEVAHHARNNPSTREVPIIFLTAMNSSTEYELRGYGSGAVDFLFKPINPSVLRSKVQVFIELFLARRELLEANHALAERNSELRELATTKARLAEEAQRANDELRAAQARLIQSAKMASLGELVAGIAHEINNPLSFAVSHLDTARRSLEVVEGELGRCLSPAGSKHWERAVVRLKEMALGLDRIRELVLKLRTFSRLDEGERKQVSLRECIDSVLTILGHRIGDRIRIEIELSEPDVVDCYPSLLNQALLNLLSNAIDAIEDRGVVGISATREDSEQIIRIHDTGTGIPEHLQDRVFEPFFTTKPVGQGTGLGLSITYSIAQKHGGTLDLRPGEQGGTTATLRLPLNPQLRSPDGA